ncbi:PepSY-like domain-containing protein [Phocaeicola sp.]|uniref:PepSY-like domain-containing protein n=1 Tax=Phocaeicola sp. TaxID=2773926 RepID=UPI003A9297ED
MKKLVFLLVCVFTVSTVAMADNEKPIQVGQLPTKAQTFITTYFKGHKVALAKQDSDLFSKSYDVIFTNGEKIEFDKSGEWTEVKCKSSGVPAQIIPSAIRTYVKNNYPDASIIQIERKRNEYEVKLSNRWEITFDSQMRVIDIDD